MAKQDSPLTEEALIKEVCKRIRVARSYWDAHNNAACRGERQRALALYNTLSKKQKEPPDRKYCGCGCATVVRNTSARTERRPSRHENKLNLTANVLTTNPILQF